MKKNTISTTFKMNGNNDAIVLPPTETIVRLGYNPLSGEGIVEYINDGIVDFAEGEKISITTAKTTERWKGIIELTDFERDDLGHLIFSLTSEKITESILGFVEFVVRNTKSISGKQATDYVGMPTKESERFYVAQNFYNDKYKGEIFALPKGIKAHQFLSEQGHFALYGENLIFFPKTEVKKRGIQALANPEGWKNVFTLGDGIKTISRIKKKGDNNYEFVASYGDGIVTALTATITKDTFLVKGVRSFKTDHTIVLNETDDYVVGTTGNVVQFTKPSRNGQIAIAQWATAI